MFLSFVTIVRRSMRHLDETEGGGRLQISFSRRGLAEKMMRGETFVFSPGKNEI